jgi:hypothetical protein
VAAFDGDRRDRELAQRAVAGDREQPGAVAVAVAVAVAEERDLQAPGSRPSS